MNEQDALARAHALGHGVAGTTSPNPPVGAVVLDAAGEVVGEGATQPPGGPHAEVVALRQAAGRGQTAVVTLEPCNHTGRTGPCSQALVEAGIRRVVVAALEPTAAAGGGIEALRAAGVEVEVVGGDPGALRPWLHVQRSGRPFVTWKYAATLDGRSAAADGSSRWITGEASRADVHRLRGEVDAVVVGVGTVLADDPELTVRPDPGHQPLRVVVDRSGRTPSNARVHPALVSDAPLPVLLKDLGDRGVVHVLLEGGPTLAGAFWREGLVDEVVAYVAPALLGAGPAALQDAGIGTIDDALRLHLTDVRRFGDDVRLTLVKEP